MIYQDDKTRAEAWISLSNSAYWQELVVDVVRKMQQARYLALLAGRDVDLNRGWCQALAWIETLPAIAERKIALDKDKQTAEAKQHQWYEKVAMYGRHLIQEDTDGNGTGSPA